MREEGRTEGRLKRGREEGARICSKENSEESRKTIRHPEPKAEPPRGHQAVSAAHDGDHLLWAFIWQIFVAACNIYFTRSWKSVISWWSHSFRWNTLKNTFYHQLVLFGYSEAPLKGKSVLSRCCHDHWVWKSVCFQVFWVSRPAWPPTLEVSWPGL